MSNVYQLEPPTHGKVLLSTTFGEVEIELWPKEAPRAVRNFVQLCMEGYYDQTIFHRLVKKFILQGGDPTGTGEGGESIYGAPFEDEFHSRLRFTHRGILAMANSLDGNDNRSQFFITLDKAEDLNRRYTVFGKVVGDTMFNVLKVNELEVDETTERPHYPPRILTTTILNNPFDDIIPRANMRMATREMNAVEKRIDEVRKKVGVKDKRLVSFGVDEEEGEGDGPAIKIKSKGAQVVPKSRATVVAHTVVAAKAGNQTSESSDDDDDEKEVAKETPIAAATVSTKSAAAIAAEAEFDRLRRELRGETPASTTGTKQTTKSETSLSMLDREREQFFQSKKDKKAVLVGRNVKRGGGVDESETIRRLAAFQAKLRQKEATSVTVSSSTTTSSTKEALPCALHNIPKCASCIATINDDTAPLDPTWLAHELRFDRDLTGKNLLDPSARRDDPNDLVVIDPRARKAQFAEEGKKGGQTGKRKDGPRSEVFRADYDPKRSRQ